ncbi:MAG: DUF6094 domain-containing protein [Methylophilaceae bacterium]
MALMFSRLAHNFVKNGYFPTDEVTLARILNALDIGGNELRILDPCCGEGTALAEVKHHLTQCGSKVTAYGVEFDAERAWHSKNILDTVAHADVNDVFITARSQGLLFLNPPYGDVVADKAALGDSAKGSNRLEKIFYLEAVPWLQFGGVMVLVIPHYVLDKEFSSMIARNFESVQVFMAPEKQFKQCVVFGIKRRSDGIDSVAQKKLEACGVGQLPPELPEYWQVDPYCVPEVNDKEMRFTSIKIDGAQLQAELDRLSKSTLWPQFELRFGLSNEKQRQPLRALTDWHLALALAAGQISGVVESASGRKLLIKGDTFKQRDLAVTYDQNADGTASEIRTFTDKFVPAITGIDFTPGASYGDVVKIR